MHPDHSKDKKGLVRRIASDMKKDVLKIGLAVGIACISKLCLAFAPGISGQIIDGIAVGQGLTEHIVQLCLILSLFIVAGYGSDGLVDTIMLRAAAGYAFRMRLRAQVKLNRVPIRYIDMHPAGDTLGRLTTDLIALTTAISTAAGSILPQLILFITVVAVMYSMDWRLATAYVLVIPLGTIVSSSIILYVRKISKARADCQGELSAKVSDTFSAHSVVKAYGCEERMLAGFDEILERYHRNNVKVQFISGFVVPAMNLVNNLGYIACCAVGGYLLIEDQLTLGEFQAFLIYGNMFMAPVVAITSGMASMQEGSASGNRFYAFLDSEEESEEPAVRETGGEQRTGEVAFEQVSFRYDPEVPLMKNVDFHVKQGMTVAIVGPTGAGKTTLVNLLLRFYDIRGGKILLEGNSIMEMPRAEVRKKTGIVLQDSWIFEGTVAENIAYGRKDATREEIVQAAVQTGCDRFIEKLPQGYDTLLTEKNMPLSDGEKQLLSIARTILADRRILILDEATSQVDTRTEYVITQAMEELMKGRTTFIIAHRLFTIRNADMILYMEDGDVKETGSHEELMKLKGNYSRLYIAASDRAC